MYCGKRIRPIYGVFLIIERAIDMDGLSLPDNLHSHISSLTLNHRKPSSIRRKKTRIRKVILIENQNARRFPTLLVSMKTASGLIQQCPGKRPIIWWRGGFSDAALFHRPR